jgi:hypothetical protein
MVVARGIGLFRPWDLTGASPAPGGSGKRTSYEREQAAAKPRNRAAYQRRRHRAGAFHPGDKLVVCGTLIPEAELLGKAG